MPEAPSDALGATPTPAPRPITAAARRRSWLEPRVRVWWLAACAVTLVAAVAAGGQLAASARDRWLLTHGVRVKARIVEANGYRLKGKVFGPDEHAHFRLEIPLPGRQSYITDRVYLKDQREDLGYGMEVDLFVDPGDPSRWTDRIEASFLRDIMVLLVTLPAAALLLLAAWWRRRSVLRVWREGLAHMAVVVDVRKAATAPLSRMVCFAVQDSRDNRVYRSLVPRRCGPLAAGDALWVVAPAGRPQRAIVAALYQ